MSAQDNRQGLDDTEEPEYVIQPTEDVYSYFMFVAPTEAKKEGLKAGGWTMDIILAYILAALNLLFQGTLLYCIFNEVVTGNIEWQDGIMNVGGKGLDLITGPVDGCNDGGSLCTLENKTFTCAPPSVQLTGRWTELDTNGDGIWTYDEVQAAREELKCKYVVDPVEVFNVFVKFLLAREKIIWIHPDLRAGKAIHKAYFTYAAGDIIMCGYRNEKMCPNLLKRGVFHAPLKYGTAPRVGTTIDTALKYCYNLLKPGGMCEMSLPSTYSVWKIAGDEQCGAKSYSKFVYEHPSGDVDTKKSLLAVDYEARESFEMSKSTTFKLYKCIIIFLWCLTMAFHLKECLIAITWLVRFPDAADFGSDAVIVSNQDEIDKAKEDCVQEEDWPEPSYKIQGITTMHRGAMAVLTFFRTFMTAVLTWVGVSYLLKSTDYIGLLMDAVALVFIVEIAQILYSQVLRPDIREQCESIEDMRVPMFGIDYLNRRPALTDAVQLGGIIVVVIVIIYFHYENLVDPLYESLECTCLSRGKTCREAQRFSYEFWYDYWKVKVPEVFATVAKLREGVTEAAAAPAPAAPSSMLNILSRKAQHHLGNSF